MSYLNRLSTNQVKTLLTEMRISMIEDFDKTPYSCWGGRLHVFHGKTDDVERIESIYKDFEIEKIYNSEPSDYDQRKYKNCMIVLLQNTNYLKEMRAYFAEQRRHYDEERIKLSKSTPQD